MLPENNISFSSKELQNAAVTQSSITAKMPTSILSSDISTQIQRYFAIKNSDTYNAFVLGSIQGSKSAVNAKDLLLILISAIQNYLNNLNDEESGVKIKLEKITRAIELNIELLLSIGTESENIKKESMQIRNEIQALLLGILTKNL